MTFDEYAAKVTLLVDEATAFTYDHDPDFIGSVVACFMLRVPPEEVARRILDGDDTPPDAGR